ncbi:MAG: rhamnulokinase [Suipraeoptans sp.]
MNKKLIGIDVGASGGKMAWGEFDGIKMNVIEYINFANRPVDIGSALYWDVFSIYNSIIDGITYFNAKYGEADTVAIDTWGASFGLLDVQGRLLEPVYHYRDRRTEKTINDMESVMSAYELFQLTGCQCNRTYTLPQLFSYKTSNEKVLDNAENMLLLPDLLSYFLTGVKSTEQTIAGTSCMMESSQEEWSSEVIERISIPSRNFTDITAPGTYKGPLADRLKMLTGMKTTKVVATVGHDSASAVAAIPNFGEGQLYISIGTNISIGIESSRCILTKEAYEEGFKNTAGIDKSKIIYRDFSASWHINEFIRSKNDLGIKYNHRQLIELAKQANKGVPWFDVEAQEFNNAGGDFCDKMNAYFRRTRQRELHEDKDFIRSIYESIALKVQHYALAYDKLNVSIEKISVISGAVRNELLMQLICNFLNRDICAGMEYATLNGNLLTQLYAEGEVGTVTEMRSLADKTFVMKEYRPESQRFWREAVSKYEDIMTEV